MSKAPFLASNHSFPDPSVNADLMAECLLQGYFLEVVSKGIEVMVYKSMVSNFSSPQDREVRE